MKKLFIIILLLVANINIQAQRLGFIAGYSDIGYNNTYYQPHYGFVVSDVLNKIIGLEVSYIHYQPSYNSIKIHDSLPDYQKFGFNIKYGYFREWFSIYGTQGLSLNSSFRHHLGFHTHLSTNFGAGIEFVPFRKDNPRWSVDIRYSRDIGLGYAQTTKAGDYYTYNGNMFSMAIKLKLNVKQCKCSDCHLN